MAPEKEKPTVETVQQDVKVSDLLMFDVCEPLKEKLDRIELCSPYITYRCLPFTTCIPSPVCNPAYGCLPGRFCKPTILNCVPNLFCLPREICQPDIPETCAPSAGTPWGPDPGIIKQQLLESDYVKLQAEVKTLKAEVEALKKRLK